MRLAVSSLITIFTCLWVGSPSTRVSIVCGIWALMLSAETVSDMIAFLNFVQEREGEASCMSDGNADGSNQKRRRETVWGFGVCGNVGEGDTGYDGDGALNCRFCC